MFIKAVRYDGAYIFIDVSKIVWFTGVRDYDSLGVFAEMTNVMLITGEELTLNENETHFLYRIGKIQRGEEDWTYCYEMEEENEQIN